MKLTTKRFFTISFLTVSAIFFMTIAGCKNLTLQEVLRVKKLANRATDVSLKALLVTMYCLDGWNTLTLESTNETNRDGDYVVIVTEIEDVSAAHIRAVPKVQGGDGDEPSIDYSPGEYILLTYDDLDPSKGGGDIKVEVTVTSIDGSTEEVYNVIFRAGTVYDPLYR